LIGNRSKEIAIVTRTPQDDYNNFPVAAAAFRRLVIDYVFGFARDTRDQFIGDSKRKFPVARNTIDLEIFH